jgi:hypothetical protein
MTDAPATPTDEPLDLRAVRREVKGRLTALPSPDRSVALRTLARLDPERWALEWHLPWWIGGSLGVAPAVALELVVGNVLGLIAIRLEDDLEDGEVAARSVRASGTAHELALDLAIDAYRALVPGESPFWTELRRLLAERRSPERQPESLSIDQLGSPSMLRRLANRGSPLKVAPLACCHLAGRLGEWPAMQDGLEHALAALVLYDDVIDWEIDLAAGRWNAFVAVSATPDLPPGRRETDVLAALMTGSILDAYFGLIDHELGRATAWASLGCQPLARHLRGYAASVSRQGADWAAYYREVGDRATELLMGDRPRSPLT